MQRDTTNIEQGRIILRSKATGNVYSTANGVEFTNHTTGAQGTATAEQVKAAFIIPLQLNEMITTNPTLLTLIETLNLSVEL